MTKDEYVEMLYQRTEYLKSEIADFEQCNGGVEQARLWDIKEQVSCIFGLIDACDKELFPDTIRYEKTEQEYIQTCNTEQLAEVIGNIAKNAYLCGQNGKTNKCVNRHNCTGYCDYGWEKWLKQPHTKE